MLCQSPVLFPYVLVMNWSSFSIASHHSNMWLVSLIASWRCVVVTFSDSNTKHQVSIGNAFDSSVNYVETKLTTSDAVRHNIVRTWISVEVSALWGNVTQHVSILLCKSIKIEIP